MQPQPAVHNTSITDQQQIEASSGKPAPASAATSSDDQETTTTELAPAPTLTVVTDEFPSAKEYDVVVCKNAGWYYVFENEESDRPYPAADTDKDDRFLFRCRRRDLENQLEVTFATDADDDSEE